MAVIAIAAALALLGIVAITVVSIPLQQVEAGGCIDLEKGKFNGRALNASQGRCIQP